MLRQPFHHVRRRPRVRGYVVARPAAEGEARFQRVEREAAFVEGRGARVGEERGGDEAAGGLGGLVSWCWEGEERGWVMGRGGWGEK